MNFNFTISTNGKLMANFVFANQAEVMAWLKKDFKLLCNKYGALSFRLSAIKPLSVGDKCVVIGEGFEVFKIAGIRKNSEYNYSYLLDAGHYESVNKCHPLMGEGLDVPQSLKQSVQKAGFNNFQVKGQSVFASS